MKKKYIFVDMKDFSDGDYKGIYKVYDDSENHPAFIEYLMDIDVVKEPESVKRQKERNKKIDTILK